MVILITELETSYFKIVFLISERFVTEGTPPKKIFVTNRMDFNGKPQVHFSCFSLILEPEDKTEHSPCPGHRSEAGRLLGRAPGSGHPAARGRRPQGNRARAWRLAALSLGLGSWAHFQLTFVFCFTKLETLICLK